MNQFEKDIQKKFIDFEAEPPQDTWASIESRLDKKDTYIILWRRRLAAAAAVLLLLASASLLLLKPIQQDQLAEETTFSSADNESLPSEEITTPAPPVVTPPGKSTITLPYGEDSKHISPKSSDASGKAILLAQSPSENPESVASSTETLQESDFAKWITMKPMQLEKTSLLAEAKNLPLAKTTYDTHTIAAHQQSDYSSRNRLTLSDETALSSFTLASYFAPQQAYRYQNSNTPNPMQSLESEIMTFATGINVNYKINNRWELQSGLGFNRLGQRVNDIASFSHPSMMPLYTSNGVLISEHPQSMSTSMGGIVFTDQSLYFADISSTRIITLKGSYDESVVNLLNKTGTGLIQHLEYLELPVSARYKFIDRGLAIYAKAGVSAAYLLTGNVYLQGKAQTTPIGKIVGVSTFNFSGTGGLAFSYPVSNRINLNLEPTASIFLKPIGQIRNLTRETYPYTWSVLMGVSYRL